MRTLLALSLMLALALPAVAEECVPTTSPSGVCALGRMYPCVGQEAAGHYIAEDGCPLLASIISQCHYTFWIYEESNGIAGLQRADEIVDDTCRGQIAGDTIIF